MQNRSRAMTTLLLGLAIVGGTAAAAAAGTDHSAPSQMAQATQTAAPKAESNGDTSAFYAKKNAFLADAQKEYDEWQERMAKISDTATEKGGKLSAEAKSKLHSAWETVKDRYAKVKAADAKTWDKSRLSFKGAVTKLHSDWDKYRPLG